MLSARVAERGKMWILAHVSVTKLERGFHNLTVNGMGVEKVIFTRTHVVI